MTPAEAVETVALGGSAGLGLAVVGVLIDYLLLACGCRWSLRELIDPNQRAHPPRPGISHPAPPRRSPPSDT